MDNTQYIYLNDRTSDAPNGNTKISIGLTPIKERKKEHIFDKDKEMSIATEYTLFITSSVLSMKEMYSIIGQDTIYETYPGM